MNKKYNYEIHTYIIYLIFYSDGYLSILFIINYGLGFISE